MYVIDATIHGYLHKDMASKVTCSLSQAMALNGMLDGDQAGFFHLQTKAGTAMNGLFGHYGCFGERLSCGLCCGSHTCSSFKGITH